MFSKILIANRGEIAVRIIRTARRMGIKTVAVYSDADAGSVAVEMADEAVHIGPAPAAQSYLLADKIIEAAKATGAEAIHPGFGFLSEKAGFAKAVADAGLVFIGPPPGAIEAMGDKIESKKLAKEAGVSTVPGFLGAIDSPDHAVSIAKDIGYPVMLKASAGGGGKGMRIARTDAEVRDGLASAMNEARNSFGDERVFIEKFVEQPRHIEIQVLADGHGNCIYLGERECSIQRRHQKVIEEAPSPFLDEETRRAMGEQAVALSKAVGYRSAGTVEFIVGPDRSFYFLEMNTRLQVEHPVTEMVTGLDLVEQMIRVAAGEKLSLTQEQVKLDGWSIEVRLYAEDPTRNFVPSTGRLVRYRPPSDMEGVRIDAGVGEGSEISVFYDPMIAKLVTWGRDRGEAIDRMRAALDRYYVRGISHNLAFLNATLSMDRFREGRLSTAFIEEEFADGFSGIDRATAVADVLVPVAAIVQRMRAGRDATISGQLPGHRHRAGDEWVVRFAGEEYPVTVTPRGEGWSVERDGRSIVVETEWEPGHPVFLARIDGREIAVQVDPARVGYRLCHGGADLVVEVLAPRAAELARLMPEKVPPDMSRLLVSPMPGLLVRVSVEVGEQVEEGQELAVVEAMKMENVLRAQKTATVKSVNAKPGDGLAADQVILEFE